MGEAEQAVLVDDFRANAEGGGRLVREAAAGQPLGGGLPSLAQLAGRRVEVRDLEHRVVLYGHVPGAESEHDAEPVHHEEDHHDAESGAEVHLEVDLRPEHGHEVLRLEMHDLPHHEPSKAAARRRSADVLMDDGTGSLERVATVRVDRRGRARLVYRTRRGDALPFGAATLRELSGRAFEVRVGGLRAVGGSLPAF